MFNIQGNLGFINQQQNPGGMGIFGGNNGSSVKLLCISPRNHGDISIRAQIFDFNGGVVNRMLENFDAKVAVSKFGSDPLLLASIKPEAHGTQFNTALFFDSLWSFVLIIDQVGRRPNQFTLPNRRRQVLTGYFLEEPLVPHTMHSSQPVHNPNALMMFTHDMAVASTSGMHNAGSVYSYATIHNNDVVNPMLNMHVASHDMYLVDSGSIARCSAVGDNGRVRSDAPAALGSTSQTEASPTLGMGVRSPKHQLMSIADGLSSAAAVCNEGLESFGSLDHVAAYADPRERFIGEFLQNLCVGGTSTMTSSGFDASRMITIGQLDALMVNNHMPEVHIIPCAIPKMPSYDRRNQGDANPQNVFSSMASSAITALAYEHRISHIAFRYNSYMKSPGSYRPGHWELFNAASMLSSQDGADATHFSAALNAFKNDLQNTVFPIISASVGEFDIIVHCDLSGNTVVDLNLLDHTQVGGLYEHSNLLGGLICPALGSHTAFSHNAHQLDGIAESAANIVMGRREPQAPNGGSFFMPSGHF